MCRVAFLRTFFLENFFCGVFALYIPYTLL